mgnify:CR=1 FL=1
MHNHAWLRALQLNQIIVIKWLTILLCQTPLKIVPAWLQENFYLGNWQPYYKVNNFQAEVPTLKCKGVKGLVFESCYIQTSWLGQQM